VSGPELLEGERAELLGPAHMERAPRRRRKSTSFEIPERSAPSVRALWESASEEEKARAHRSGMAILESWTGRASWQEVAERLDLPPVRVHQLSQQALSGMLAGLLVQPRTRRKRAGLPPLAPEDDPVELRKRIRALETKLSRTEDLVRVLQELPWHRPAKEKEVPRGGKRGKRRRKPAAGEAKLVPGGTAEPGGEAEAGRDGHEAAPEGA
jgi:hypothetical protein